MSTIRKIKRNQLKKELGTNNIADEFHKRYGEKPNVNKGKVKLLERLKRKLRKLAHKKARERRKNNELETKNIT